MGDPLEDALRDGHYVYMQDLQVLSRRTPASPQPLPPSLMSVTTPLQVDVWQSLLASHPDPEFKRYIIAGITQGFRIGFQYSHSAPRGTKRNMQSALENPSVIDSYLAKECALGRVAGPFTIGTLPLHVNRFGVIPKPHQPGKWRLIVDMSSPPDHSINDGIEPELCSLTYASTDDAVANIISMGKGTLLAKLDLESTYRIVPVHPDDRLLLGMEWKGCWYVDTVLPFGLRSAPKIFTAVADGLIWIMGNNGIKKALHYLDDYLFFGRPRSSECAEALSCALSLCEKLGVPTSKEKIEGPSTALSFLGILLDAEAGEIQLPEEKLQRLKAVIRGWMCRKSCKKRELLSLIGQLQHACKVVRYGRMFLRRMINLSMTAKYLHHHIRLNASFRSDLLWWATFLPSWNGVSMMSVVQKSSPDVTVTSDASGNWGCGAYNSKGQWFQFQWPVSWASVHITVKELLPIIMAVAIWGKVWRGRTVRCVCDNAAVVAIVNSGKSRNDLVMHLMRCLFFFLAHFNVFLFAVHLPGRDNIAADALSRDNLPLFLQQVQHAAQQPTLLPEELIQALVTHLPDWTSQNWRTWFTSILEKV